MMRPLLIFCGFIALGAGWLPAQLSKAETKQLLRMLQAAPTMDAVLDSLARRDYHPDLTTLDVVREALWQRWIEEQNRFPARRKAFERGECTYGTGKTGMFSLQRKGVAPASGYPLYIGLHGGGGGPKEMNDEQWTQMQAYYLEGIDTGIYVAPRGPNNTWNLHFDDDALAFYGQLLRDLRVFAGIDPNRIYLMGYSAGGDGVYQLAPRMAMQLAAANMSAGHHNGVRADNLQHLPMLLQVGELDDAYDRNVETVRYARLLDSLSRQFPGYFQHQVYVHAGAQHSYVRDRMGADHQAVVLADPRAWLLNHKAQDTALAITDAPTWLRQFRRNPYPLEIRWDLQTRLAGEPQWYWVSVQSANENLSGAKPAFVQVKAFPAQNRIEVKEFQGRLTLHLHEQIADPGRLLTVVVDGREHAVPLRASMQVMAAHLVALEDPACMAWQEVTISRDGSGKVSVR